MTKQATTLSSTLEGPEYSWLDKLADPLQQATLRAFSSQAGLAAKSWLNGTPIRHRVHPALIVWPLGAWTTAAMLDVMEGMSSGREAEAYRKAADTSIGFGILGAVTSAVAGLADWTDLGSHQRRVGMAHALLNTTALALYGASYALRKRGNGSRNGAKTFAGLGYMAVLLGGSIGGELVYTLGVNVPFMLYPKPPNEFRDVLASSDLREGQPVVVEFDRIPVMLYRHQGQVYAVENWCPHAGGPLAEGQFQGDVVQCPWHGSKFCLADGAPLQGPASVPLRTFEVREQNGRISVKPSYEAQDWPPPPHPLREQPQFIPLEQRQQSQAIP